MELTEKEKAAFRAAGEPSEEPDYMDAARRLRETLTPGQKEQLLDLLEAFGELVRYERRWYFGRGYRAGEQARE